jgi:tetratricopeptide (TPR) repeat protein
VLLVAFGVGTALGTIELGLRAAGFAFVTMATYRNREALRAGTTDPVVLCLGESTTALGGADSFPTQLGQVLHDHGQRATVINAGVPAITTDVIRDLPALLAEYQPQVVVAMMGVNDPPAPDDGSALGRALRGLRVAKLAAYIANGLSRRATGEDETAAAGTARLAAATAAHPDDAAAQVALGEQLMQVGRPADARAPLERALALRLDDARAAIALGHVLFRLGDPDRADAVLAASADAAPADTTRQWHIGLAYLSGRRDDRAEAVLLRALAARPDPALSKLLEAAYYDRASRAIADGRLDDAQAALDRAAALPSMQLPEIWHARRAFLARARGDHATFDAEMVLGAEATARAPHGMTHRNYQELRRLARNAGARVVAVQYPLRSLASLEDLVDHDPDVAVVGNETPFHDALARATWETYFSDTFAGDFGHLTHAGNRLLAEDVAPAVTAALAGDSAIVAVRHAGTP